MSGETTGCIGAAVQKPGGIDVINSLFELWANYVLLQGGGAGCGRCLNAGSRQPRVTGEPGERRRPAVASPGRAERGARAGSAGQPFRARTLGRGRGEAGPGRGRAASVRGGLRCE